MIGRHPMLARALLTHAKEMEEEMKTRRRTWHVSVVLAAAFLILSSAAYAGHGCRNKTGEPGDFRDQTILSGGVESEYNLYVHPRYKPNRPTPLVFLFHGLS